MATIPREQFEQDVCHVCFRELDELAGRQAGGPIMEGYQCYCSAHCKEADEFATRTHPVHQLVPQISEQVLADIQRADR